MNEENILFVCSTNYTILNAINTVVNNLMDSKGKSDLLIFMRNASMIQYIRNLYKEKIFNHIYVYDFVNYSSNFNKAKIIINPKNYLTKNYYPEFDIFKLDINYSLIISQSLFYNTIFQRMNKKADFYMIEEGLSTYTSRTIDPNKRSRLYKLISIMFRLPINGGVKGQIVYRPEMLQDIANQGDIIKLPSIDRNCFEFINSAFKCNTNNSIYEKEKYIYLSAPLFGLRGLIVDGPILDELFEDECEKLLFKSLDLIRQGNIVYRKHPLEQEIDTNGRNYIVVDYSNSMWELDVYDYIDSESILISYFSTATFTPKLLYDKEPVVIFLYKLVGKPFYNSDDVVNSLRSIYRNQDKIIVPNTLDELREYMKKIRK